MTQSTEAKTVTFTHSGHTAVVTLNRPEQLNCFNYTMLTELEEAVAAIRFDDQIRSVVFTGAGEKAFSAGADLKERRTLTEGEVRRNVRKIREVFDAVESLPQPTIAAVNGHALGGGFELMLACDLRLAVPDAWMGLTEVSWAIIPGAGGTQRLPRLIGMTKAKELILTARRFQADEADALGLLNRVSTKASLLEDAQAIADAIGANGPLAVRQAKMAIHHGAQTDLHTGQAIEAGAYERIIPTEDRLEALEAFREKRPARFQGR
ncbi:enoyl-CoA hydratase-related protein [Alkalicoccus urumqiensis]|uniref:Enoyl-CoA hydratase n=1 Tax=Alkalicoccus urumqiensis TaxID=1548213 RepID=A0A2P6ME00_ALKUR|nr:enoyl-CoA hydratase-related protein [Alkalicoccus urumqiensis]PRO64500.1 enoyl-CoA hydratase [Alkalicoccus urumqiensis]